MITKAQLAEIRERAATLTNYYTDETAQTTEERLGHVGNKDRVALLALVDEYQSRMPQLRVICGQLEDLSVHVPAVHNEWMALMNLLDELEATTPGESDSERGKG